MAVLTEPERSLSAVPIISGVVQAQSLHAKIALRIPARTLTPRAAFPPGRSWTHAVKE
jgi:hypothetical protein